MQIDGFLLEKDLQQLPAGRILFIFPEFSTEKNTRNTSCPARPERIHIHPLGNPASGSSHSCDPRFIDLVTYRVMRENFQRGLQFSSALRPKRVPQTFIGQADPRAVHLVPDFPDFCRLMQRRHMQISANGKDKVGRLPILAVFGDIDGGRLSQFRNFYVPVQPTNHALPTLDQVPAVAIWRKNQVEAQHNSSKARRIRSL